MSNEFLKANPRERALELKLTKEALDSSVSNVFTSSIILTLLHIFNNFV